MLDSNVIYYRSEVETVAVPRCDACATLHKREKELKFEAGLWVVLGGLLSIGVGVCMYLLAGADYQIPDWAVLLLFLPFFASLPLAVHALLRSEDYKVRGIREEGQIGEWPRVQELRKEGYDYGDRPSGSYRAG